MPIDTNYINYNHEEQNEEENNSNAYMRRRIIEVKMNDIDECENNEYE